MTNITIKTNGASITAKSDGKITSGMVGVPVYIEYDDSWNNLTKTGFFRVGSQVRKRLNIEEETTVPWEILRTHGKPLEIGVEGRDADGNIIMPTIWCTVATVYQGASGGINAAPNPDSGEQPSGDGAIIDDSKVSANTTWSSQKISEEIGNGGTGGGITDEELADKMAVVIDEEYNAWSEGNGSPIIDPIENVANMVTDNIVPVMLGNYGLLDWDEESETLTRNVVTYEELEEAVGNIETAIDSILAIQNQLMGGDSL